MNNEEQRYERVRLGKPPIIEAYVFDLDGTLADPSHRLHYIQRRPKDWRSFYASVSQDAPIEHMCRLAVALSHRPIVFVSGRSDECREATEAWLDLHLFRRTLYMRKEGDHREDSIVKMELLAAMRADGLEPIMVFDDRTRVVNAWREAGVPCAQVAPGDF